MTSRSRRPRPPHSTSGPTARRSACSATAGCRVGIYAGMGCARCRPVARGGRRAAPGAGGHLGQRQGLHSRCAPARRRLGLRQAGDPHGRAGVQGRRPGPCGRSPLQRGLDRQLRHPPARPVDPRRCQPATTSAATSSVRQALLRFPGVPRSPARRRRGDPAPALPAALEEDPRCPRARPGRERRAADHRRRRPDVLPDAAPVRWAPRS